MTQNTPKTANYFIHHDCCADLECGRRLEWLVTNGRGGFAMAAVNQMLTRRYHGLLVAAVDPPVERFVLLAKLDATATVAGRSYELATNDYVGAVHPHGHRFLNSFTAHSRPTWHWRVGDVVIEQTLCMARGEDTTFVRYRLIEGKAEVTLSVQPLCTSRHFHRLAKNLDFATPVITTSNDRLTLSWSGHRPVWHLSHNGTFDAKPDWYYQFFLAAEARRGYDATQDLFIPGTITARLRPRDEMELIIAASTQERSWKDGRQAFSQVASSDGMDGAAQQKTTPTNHNPQSTIRNPQSEDPLLELLMRATGDFLVSRNKDFKTVIAGYPWFGDWGRDTFISLPGLCLVPRRLDEARKIIQAFAEHVDGGMIPNRFPDYGEAPAYNTVDATLWYIHALDRYLTYSGDWAFVAEQMFPVIADILDAHVRGTRHGIRLCEDGLLAAGESGLALTWMDAQLPGHSVTPRIGKPVEINALWYNALRIAASYAERLGAADRASQWLDIAARARASFNGRFWNEAGGCLYDVIEAETSQHQNSIPNPQSAIGNRQVRPNQLFAISLTHSVLDESHWRDVVAVCERELWTPMGMRTLAPSDPAYKGRYEGDIAARDGAYHQGTVWPWLLGPFVTAYVKATRSQHSALGTQHSALSTQHSAAGQKTPDPASRLVSSRSSPREGPSRTGDGDTLAALTKARRFLDGLHSHLGEVGIGSVSEVADGDPPHTPGGCPWQAWSVAEPLRALCEDILRTHPPAARKADAKERQSL